MEFTLISPFLPSITDKELFSRIREKKLGQPTTRQSQIAINVATANIDNASMSNQRNGPTPSNSKPRAAAKPYGSKLIIHYTHEKRFHSMKREMHQIYDDVFKNSPVQDLKVIVGTRNRRDARNDLIRKRPSRALLRNKRIRSKLSKSLISTSYFSHPTFFLSCTSKSNRNQHHSSD